MNISWWLPISLGFKDGFNPGDTMACAVLAVLYLWFEARGISPRKFLAIFVCSLCAFNLLLNLGFFAGIVLSDLFQRAMLGIHFVLAFVFAAIGVVFLYDWVLWSRGKDPALLLSRRVFQPKGVASISWRMTAAMVLAGIVMSLVASIWPPNLFIIVISNNLFVRGLWFATAKVLAFYTVTALWLIVLTGVLLSWSKMTPRLRQMVCAAIFLAAAAAVFYSNNIFGGTAS